jgi:acetate kinase
MKILVLNSGSSSVKFQLLQMDGQEVLLKGLVEKIGSTRAILGYDSPQGHRIRDVREIPNHDEALRLIMETITRPELGILSGIEEIRGVGHRVVHGGEEFSESVLIDERVIEAIERCTQFAPLHNPANLQGIQVCLRLMPDTPQVAVFDTAFHNRMPEHAYLYALPAAVYRALGIRRYGFHGTSHKYVAQRAAETLGEPLEELRLITCHLGNGASIAAVDRGRSVDTSMGFTPLEGLVMGTRCGDLDPAVVSYLMQAQNLTPREVDALMNKQSGLLGLTETTNDVREIIEEADRGSAAHKMALEVFTYRIKKYIGAYLAALGGADAVVFTGGIGENAGRVRAMILQGLEFCGVRLDTAANDGNAVQISSGDLTVLVIATNEELAIAQDTSRILAASRAEEAAEGPHTELLRAEIEQISADQKAQLILLWARNVDDSLSEVTRKFNHRYATDFSEEAIEAFLRGLDLLDGHPERTETRTHV